MSRTQRVAIRVIAIGLQWIALTIALGALVMRSDRSYDQLIDPHFGAVPMFIGALIAGFLLGMTVEAPRYLAPLVIALSLAASMFVGIVAYAPVADGLLVRTPALDNYVAQRVILLFMILVIISVPAAVGGNLLGGRLRIEQEVAPHPNDLEESQETPWWERRRSSRSDQETGHHPV